MNPPCVDMDKPMSGGWKSMIQCEVVGEKGFIDKDKRGGIIYSGLWR